MLALQCRQMFHVKPRRAHRGSPVLSEVKPSSSATRLCTAARSNGFIGREDHRFARFAHDLMLLLPRQKSPDVAHRDNRRCPEEPRNVLNPEARTANRISICKASIPSPCRPISWAHRHPEVPQTVDLGNAIVNITIEIGGVKALRCNRQLTLQHGRYCSQGLRSCLNYARRKGSAVGGKVFSTP